MADGEPDDPLGKVIERTLFLHYDPLEAETATIAEQTGDTRILDYMIAALERRAKGLRETKSKLEEGLGARNDNPNGSVDRETYETPKDENNGGEWLTITELIEKGSSRSKQELRSLLKSADGSGLEVRHRSGVRGQPYEVLVTPDTVSSLGLEKNSRAGDKVQQPVERDVASVTSLPEKNSSSKEFELRYGKVELRPGVNYKRTEVEEVLRRVDPLWVSSPATAEKLFEVISHGEDHVPGDNLIELVESIEDGLLLDSKDTIGKLAELGLCEKNEHPSNVRAALNGEVYAGLVYALPRVEEKAFIREQDLPTLRERIGDERKRTLTQFHNNFKNKDIMPPGRSYDKLADAGIFDSGSLPAIERTYGAYERAMKGWELFPDLAEFVARLPAKWTGFDAMTPRLKDKGLIKDLIEELSPSGMGSNRPFRFFVLAKGRKAELYDFAGLQSPN